MGRICSAALLGAGIAVGGSVVAHADSLPQISMPESATSACRDALINLAHVPGAASSCPGGVLVAAQPIPTTRVTAPPSVPLEAVAATPTPAPAPGSATAEGAGTGSKPSTQLNSVQGSLPKPNLDPQTEAVPASVAVPEKPVGQVLSAAQTQLATLAGGSISLLSSAPAMTKLESAFHSPGSAITTALDFLGGLSAEAGSQLPLNLPPIEPLGNAHGWGLSGVSASSILDNLGILATLREVEDSIQLTMASVAQTVNDSERAAQDLSRTSGLSPPPAAPFPTASQSSTLPSVPPADGATEPAGQATSSGSELPSHGSGGTDGPTGSTSTGDGLSPTPVSGFTAGSISLAHSLNSTRPLSPPPQDNSLSRGIPAPVAPMTPPVGGGIGSGVNVGGAPTSPQALATEAASFDPRVPTQALISGVMDGPIDLGNIANDLFRMSGLSPPATLRDLASPSPLGGDSSGGGLSILGTATSGDANDSRSMSRATSGNTGSASFDPFAASQAVAGTGGTSGQTGGATANPAASSTNFVYGSSNSLALTVGGGNAHAGAAGTVYTDARVVGKPYTVEVSMPANSGPAVSFATTVQMSGQPVVSASSNPDGAAAAKQILCAAGACGAPSGGFVSVSSDSQYAGESLLSAAGIDISSSDGPGHIYGSANSIAIAYGGGSAQSTGGPLATQSGYYGTITVIPVDMPPRTGALSVSTSTATGTLSSPGGAAGALTQNSSQGAATTATQASARITDFAPLWADLFGAPTGAGASARGDATSGNADDSTAHAFGASGSSGDATSAPSAWSSARSGNGGKSGNTGGADSSPTGTSGDTVTGQSNSVAIAFGRGDAWSGLAGDVTVSGHSGSVTITAGASSGRSGGGGDASGASSTAQSAGGAGSGSTSASSSSSAGSGPATIAGSAPAAGPDSMVIGLFAALFGSGSSSGSVSGGARSGDATHSNAMASGTSGNTGPAGASPTARSLARTGNGGSSGNTGTATASPIVSSLSRVAGLSSSIAVAYASGNAHAGDSGNVKVNGFSGDVVITASAASGDSGRGGSSGKATSGAVASGNAGSGNTTADPNARAGSGAASFRPTVGAALFSALFGGAGVAKASADGNAESGAANNSSAGAIGISGDTGLAIAAPTAGSAATTGDGGDSGATGDAAANPVVSSINSMLAASRSIAVAFDGSDATSGNSGDINVSGNSGDVTFSATARSGSSGNGGNSGNATSNAQSTASARSGDSAADPTAGAGSGNASVAPTVSAGPAGLLGAILGGGSATARASGDARSGSSDGATAAARGRSGNTGNAVASPTVNSLAATGRGARSAATGRATANPSITAINKVSSISGVIAVALHGAAVSTDAAAVNLAGHSNGINGEVTANSGNSGNGGSSADALAAAIANAVARSGSSTARPTARAGSGDALFAPSVTALIGFNLLGGGEGATSSSTGGAVSGNAAQSGSTASASSGDTGSAIAAPQISGSSVSGDAPDGGSTGDAGSSAVVDPTTTDTLAQSSSSGDGGSSGAASSTTTGDITSASGDSTAAAGAAAGSGDASVTPTVIAESGFLL